MHLIPSCSAVDRHFLVRHSPVVHSCHGFLTALAASCQEDGILQPFLSYSDAVLFSFGSTGRASEGMVQMSCLGLNTQMLILSSLCSHESACPARDWKESFLWLKLKGAFEDRTPGIKQFFLCSHITASSQDQMRSPHPTTPQSVQQPSLTACA